MKNPKIVIALCMLLYVVAALVPNGAKPTPNQPIAQPPAVQAPKSSQKQAKDQTDNQLSQTAANNSQLTNRQPTQKLSSQPAYPAPAQAAIRHKVAVEHTYYALALSNDTYAASSWALQAVKAPQAWDVATGSSAVTVAVIDSGFALNHQDLDQAWFINSAESGNTAGGEPCWTGSPANKQTNNCDDDNNGYVDDWRGWDFDAIDNQPQAGTTDPNGDGVSHGTRVAGLVAAETNNGQGIASVAWGARLMPLQVLNDDGVGYTSDVVAAIYYAVDNGADVINMSLGGASPDSALQTAINYAISHDVLVVAAAGNCGSDSADSVCSQLPAGGVTYPALYPDVIAVGATNSSDQVASFSSYGEAVDVSAPGSGTIVSTTWTSGNQTSAYASSLQGTSFSAPMVSSVAALIKAVRPDTSVEDVTALLTANTTRPSGMGSHTYNKNFGHGIVDSQAALNIASSLNGQIESSPTLLNSGGYIAEGITNGMEPLSSGCQTILANTACTVRFKNITSGHRRYMPYQISNESSLAGWSWAAIILGGGAWEVRTQQGERLSNTPYYIESK